MQIHIVIEKFCGVPSSVFDKLEVPWVKEDCGTVA
jgi:hypothetical protein